MTELASSYVKTLTRIKDEIKKVNLEAKRLRKIKVAVETKLISYMKQNHLEEYDGIKLIKLIPKKTVRKPMKAKKQDAIYFLQEHGIDDPEEFWKSLQETQKILQIETEI